MYKVSRNSENLDSKEFIIDKIYKIIRKGNITSINSEKDFEKGFREIIYNRIIETELNNPYSMRINETKCNLKQGTKNIFVSMNNYALGQDVSRKNKLFLDLCYLKQEFKPFKSEYKFSLFLGGGSSEMSNQRYKFKNYILQSEMLYSKKFGLNVWEHLDQTHKFNTVSGQKIYRLAHQKIKNYRNIYISDSTADSLVFDSTQSLYDAILTLPGLKLVDITENFLVEIANLLDRKIGIIEAGHKTRLILNIGYVDKLRIIGSMTDLNHDELTQRLLKYVSNMASCVKKFNKLTSNLTFEINTSTFPISPINNTKINGLINFYNSNRAASKIVDKVLKDELPECSVEELFKPNTEIELESLIHEREIHPKLGLEVLSLSRLLKNSDEQSTISDIG